MRFRIGIGLAAISLVSAVAFTLGCGQSAASKNESASATPAKAGPSATGSDEVFNGEKLVRSEAEWKKQLTPAAFNILREEGTDYPYKSQYHDSKEKGDYYCAACHLKVFSSDTKFESGTGWPSFYQPVDAKNVVDKEDKSLGETRTEVECARCGSHLGHVFDDGPKPTGLRYCINGTALKFEKSK